MEWLKKILEKHRNEDGVVDIDKAMEEINKAAPKYTVPKDVYNTLSNEKKDLETQLSSYEGDKLTEDEKRQKAIDDANAKVAEYNKKLNRLDAEKILIEAGMTETDYSGFIDGIVSDDAETTKNLVTSMATTFKVKFETAAAQAKNDKLKNMQTPPPGDGTGGDKLTEAEKFAKEVADTVSCASDDYKKALDFYTK